MTSGSDAPIPLIDHTFENGICTICGAKDPNEKTGKTLGPATLFAILGGVFVLAAGVAFVIMKKKKSR